jgi:hypothetical protein
MKTKPAPTSSPRQARLGFTLVEVLAYMALLFVIIGLGYAAVYNCMDHSLVLRGNAEDITRALDAGERWRSDVRAADLAIRVETSETNQVLYLRGKQGEVDYSFKSGEVRRRVGSGPWTLILANAKASTMQAEHRQYVTVWRWELELLPRSKAKVVPGRILPLFTFQAVPPTPATL